MCGIELLWNGLITFAAALVALVTTLGFTFHIEKVKQPQFEMEVEEGPTFTNAFEPSRQDTKHLRILISNKPVKETNWFLGKWLVRDTAWKTGATILFCDVQKKPFIEIQGRWAGGQEPIIPVGVNEHRFDISKVMLGNYQDISAGKGEYEILDVAARRMKEREAFAYSNMSYSVPNKKHAMMKLQEGEYLVKVTLESGESRAEQWFVLISREEDFRLIKHEQIDC